MYKVNLKSADAHNAELHVYQPV